MTHNNGNFRNHIDDVEIIPLFCIIFTIQKKIFVGFFSHLYDSLVKCNIYEIEVLNDNYEIETLSKYAGKVTIIVNVASYCGYTDTNYKQLVQLAKKYPNQLAVSKH